MFDVTYGDLSSLRSIPRNVHEIGSSNSHVPKSSGFSTLRYRINPVHNSTLQGVYGHASRIMTLVCKSFLQTQLLQQTEDI